MRAGQLRKRFRIEQPVDNELDAAGHPVEKWKLFARAWGRVEELTAGEADGRDQKESSASMTVTIRYTKGIHSGMRLRFEDDRTSRVFGIDGIVKGQKNVEMMLSCREDRSGF